MKLFHVAAVGAAFVLTLQGCSRDGGAPSATEPAPEASRPAPQMDSLLTLDTHVDIPLDFATDAVDPLDADLQVNLEKMRTGGLQAAFFIVYVGQTARTPENYAQAQADAMTKFKAIHRMTDELYPNLIELAYTPDDVERIFAAGKLVAAIGIENGYVIGKDLDLLDRYYELGARYMTLVHNGDNDLAHTAQPRADLGEDPHGPDTGVTDFGAAAIERMNRLGIMVDVSHGSKQTALDAMRLSKAPVIASHSAVRALTDHPRNMDDETLLALRDNGGVIQVVAFDPYVKYQPPEEVEAMRALRERLGLSPPIEVDKLPDEQRNAYLQGVADIKKKWPPATVKDFVDHIDYAVKLIGIDHVGISSDFGGGGGVVGWSDATETPNVTRELQARGYDDADITKLWGRNLLRVWREVEQTAAKLKAADADNGR